MFLSTISVQHFYVQIALLMVVGFKLKMPTPLFSSYITEVLPLNLAVPAVGVAIGAAASRDSFKAHF
jgi:hypothetical protein